MRLAAKIFPYRALSVPYQLEAGIRMVSNSPPGVSSGASSQIAPAGVCWVGALIGRSSRLIFQPPDQPSHPFSRGPRTKQTIKARPRNPILKLPLALHPALAYNRFPTAVPVSCPVKPASM